MIRGGLGGDLRVVDISRRGLSSHNSVVNTLDREVRKSKNGVLRRGYLNSTTDKIGKGCIRRGFRWGPPGS